MTSVGDSLTISRQTNKHSMLLAAATAAIGSVIVLAARWGPDWPAQEFRALVSARDGLLAWTNQWYGGAALPGYSVLYPVLAAVLGAGGTGLLAVGFGAWCAGRLYPGPAGVARACYSVAVIFSLSASLLLGQIPFLLGAAFAAGGFVAFRSGRRGRTALFAAASSLASPLAGLFVLMLAVSYASKRPREALPFAGAFAGLLVAAVTGGASGPFPCPWSSMVGVGCFAAALVFCTTREDWFLRRFALLYSMAAVVAFVIPNPIGGNITRLGRLIALPLLCYLVARSHRATLRRIALFVAGGLVWALVPLVSSIAHGSGDPSRNSGYYTGLLSFLKTQQPSVGRLEIPFTREHWESNYVAAAFPLARGWERQTDLEYNSVLYKPLTAGRYRAWLDSSAVDLVALPSVPIDSGGQAEAALLANPPSYLIPVWQDTHWRVWRVRNATPIATGAGHLAALKSSKVAVQFSAKGDELIRIHDSRLWEITAGHGCISTSAAGWILLHAESAGTVTIEARLGTQLLVQRHDCD
jgi:hypothetical protein